MLYKAKSFKNIYFVKYFASFTEATLKYEEKVFS